MQHPARATPTGAALGVAVDRTILIKKAKGLLQDGLRQPQLGMGDREVLHQSCRIGIGLQETLQNPADRELQTQVLNRGTLKKSPNRLQTRP